MLVLQVDTAEVCGRQGVHEQSGCVLKQFREWPIMSSACQVVLGVCSQASSSLLCLPASLKAFVRQCSIHVSAHETAGVFAL
jgi:hypothetical protein